METCVSSDGKHLSTSYWCATCLAVTGGAEYSDDDQFGFGDVYHNDPSAWHQVAEGAQEETGHRKLN